MILTESPHLNVIALSHPGETGKNNEDRYSVTSYVLERDQTTSLLAVVADGIGGHQAGELAAQVAVSTFVREVSLYKEGDPAQVLRTAMVEAGQAVSRGAQGVPEREGMGSTLSAVWLIGWRMYLASIGDSRVYLLRRGRLQQLTIDHTWVQEAIDHQIITRAESRGHPNAHVLRRHLGSRLDPQPDLRMRLSEGQSDQEAEANQGLLLQPGDRLLMSTDGLTDLVEDSEINDTLRRLRPKEAVETLVRLARTRGGFDNITVVLLEVPGEAPTPEPAARPSLGRCLRLLLVTFIASVVLVAIVLSALAAGWWYGIGPWIRPSPTPSQSTPFPTSTFETATEKPTPGVWATPSSLPATALAASPAATSSPVPLASVTPAP